MTIRPTSVLCLIASCAVAARCTLAQPAVPPAAAAPAADDAAPAALLETNPAVRAALELPRREPADYFAAITTLTDLGRPELAKPILDELTKLPLTDAQRAALVAEFGSHSMLQLARTEELAPAGAEFAEAAMTAAAAAATDPQRIAALIDQLTDASAEIRTAARNDLLATGYAGVTATLEALARENDPQRRDALVSAAARMRPLVAGPLLAMLETSDTRLRADVVQLLQRFSDPNAAPLLAADPANRERALLQAVARYRSGTPAFAVDEDELVTIWNWDDAAKQLQFKHVPSREATIFWMARLAVELAELRPGNRTYQRQALMLGLEASLESLPPAADTGLLNEVLAGAIEQKLYLAATRAAELLGHQATSDVLYGPNAQPSPLATALLQPFRPLRFAALRAIMALDPTSPYPGSSRVPDALAWFAAGSGERRALVAMPSISNATKLAALLTAAGFDAEATSSGRQTVMLALGIPDLEMIFIDMDIDGRGIREALYELRVNPQTGDVPVALMAPDGKLEAAEKLAAEHDLVIAVPRPHSAGIVGRIVDSLAQMGTSRSTSPGERAAQAVAATAWLAQLADGGRPFYIIRRSEPALVDSLYQPESADAAITALSRLGTPEAQQALVTFASQRALPAEARSRASAAFAESVREDGLLLSQEAILLQYDRYNASAAADADTQRILGELLDAIESRRDALLPVELPSPLP